MCDQGLQVMFIIMFFSVAIKHVLSMKNDQNVNVTSMKEKYT